MTYYDDDDLADEDNLSSDLVDLLETTERFQARPRRPPVDEDELGEPLRWEARADEAGDAPRAGSAGVWRRARRAWDALAVSSRRPPPVRIDDLADPRFAPNVAEAMRAVEPVAAELRFDADSLCAQALAEAGATTFGDDRFRDRLEVLTRALRTDTPLSPMGRVSTHSQLVGHLRNRARLEALVAAHPEILEVDIRRPIVIVGQPRTGTTHLHNLMAADPGLRSLPYWESLEPVLAPDEQAAVDAGEPDPRLGRTAVGLAFLDEAAPYFKRMHEMTVDHVHEEIQLLALDVSTMLFETMAVLPTWRDYYLAHDQTSSYRYLKKVLQALQWQRGGQRWVLKSPQHLEQFGPLLEVFPDATFVVTHRDPVSVIASNATMLAYMARLNQTRPDPVRIGHYWADRIQQMLEAGMRDRDLLPADQSLDVRFDEFMADDIATVQQIYGVADQPFSSDVRAAMRAFMRDHPRGRHGGVVYDLAGDFDLDPAALRAGLRDYVARFRVAEERP